MLRPRQSETLIIPNLLRAKMEDLGQSYGPSAHTDDAGGDLFQLVQEIHCFTREAYDPTTMNREAQPGILVPLLKQ